MPSSRARARAHARGCTAASARLAPPPAPPARAGGFFSSGPKLEQCLCLDKNGSTVLQVELDSVRVAQDTVKDLLLVCNAAAT